MQGVRWWVGVFAMRAKLLEEHPRPSSRQPQQHQEQQPPMQQQQQPPMPAVRPGQYIRRPPMQQQPAAVPAHSPKQLQQQPQTRLPPPRPPGQFRARTPMPKPPSVPPPFLARTPMPKQPAVPPPIQKQPVVQKQPAVPPPIQTKPAAKKRPRPKNTCHHLGGPPKHVPPPGWTLPAPPTDEDCKLEGLWTLEELVNMLQPRHPPSGRGQPCYVCSRSDRGPLRPCGPGMMCRICSNRRWGFHLGVRAWVAEVSNDDQMFEQPLKKLRTF
jgi:hypothetical protein